MIGGRILGKIGGAIFGRVRERVTERIGERIEERFDETDPADATAGPAKPKGGWEPPSWLALILRFLNAIFPQRST